MSDIEVTELTIPTSDGYALRGELFAARDADGCRLAAVVASGAGIPKSYYANFARYLAAAGIPVLTFDYRGIGSSRPRALRRFQVSVEEWGSKDCAAALQSVAHRFPQARRAVVGHSVGGFVTGFVADPALVDVMAFVGSHTGYYGDYLPRYRGNMYLMWHVLMPAITRTVGFFPGRRLGLPEDLPYGVAMEWANRRKGDFGWNLKRADGSPDLPRRDALLERFAAFRCPLLLLRAADDAFASESATARMAGLFRHCRVTTRTVDPRQAGVGKIGHFGFFRSRMRDTLWPILRDWLVAALPGQGPATAPALDGQSR